MEQGGEGMGGRQGGYWSLPIQQGAPASGGGGGKDGWNRDHMESQGPPPASSSTYNADDPSMMGPAQSSSVASTPLADYVSQPDTIPSSCEAISAKRQALSTFGGKYSSVDHIVPC